FVERGGAVYFGYQSKLIVSNSARLNTIAADALLGRLGIPAEDPSVPMALTPWSYQGAWDIHSASATDWSHGTTVYIGPAGTVSCQRSEEHTSELQSRFDLVCRLLLEKKNMELFYPAYLHLRFHFFPSPHLSYSFTHSSF